MDEVLWFFYSLEFFFESCDGLIVMTTMPDYETLAKEEGSSILGDGWSQ
jgi:hypothetical protein